jgi:hypothetical protein
LRTDILAETLSRLDGDDGTHTRREGGTFGAFERWEEEYGWEGFEGDYGGGEEGRE